jgi:protein O-GlcNAc transferase
LSGNLHNKKQKALSLFSAKEYEQAIRILKKIIDTTPYDADCWHLLSTIYGTISNFAKADQCASRAISIQPNRAVAYLNKGNALMGLDRSGEAQNCYLKCSTLQPNNPDAFFNLALCYKSQGSLKQAEECYRRVIDLAPQRADAYNNLGNILQEKRLFDEALEAYDNAINLTPNLLEALFNKAATYLLLGRTEPAIRGFKKVLEKDPNHLQAYSRLLFAQNYSASVSPQKHYHDHTDWGDKLTKLIEPSTAYSNNINPEKVLHVGYVSPDFRNSVAVYTIELLLRHHDANKVKVYCYSYTRKPDELTKCLRTLAPAWRDISELDDMHAYQIILTYLLT